MMPIRLTSIVILLVITGISNPVVAESDYICGDANSDSAINVGDAVYLINYVFKGGPPPAEGCCDECLAEETQPCYSGPPATEGVGICAAGYQICVDGQWGICMDEILPQIEDCDGLDNDCDGATDEGLTQPPCANQQGVCAGSAQRCEGGAWVPCGPADYGPFYETTEVTCDGMDNDCDGATDENLTGPPCPMQEGVCAGSSMRCGGAIGWLACEQSDYGPDYEPEEFSCDGLDNDCDGSVDEGDPEGGGPCDTGLPGVCAQGTLHCVDGMLACVQDQYPSPEACDGLDNDCDGSVDEGDPDGGGPCDTGLPGICAEGTMHCVDGMLTCVPDQSPSMEMCDGLDNDCDGSVDEGDPEGGGPCDTGLPGICAEGTLHCDDGLLICVQNQFPTAEVCDGLDNDCDGSVDEGDPDGGGPCDTGLPGVCAQGTLHCVDGMLTCVQDNFPTPEVCDDGIDNDCDGMTDLDDSDCP